MEIPVVVEDRLRFRIYWRLLRRWRTEDGHEIGIWGHPALQLAMTPAGFEFHQIDWYTLTLSYKRRRELPADRGGIEPARLLVGAASRRLGFVYLGVYVSDWLRMLRLGQVPVEVGRVRLDARRKEKEAG